MEKVIKREKHHFGWWGEAEKKRGSARERGMKRGIVRGMKAAEEKHQPGGKGCWHRRLGPLQVQLPRVRAGNPWACRGWWGQHEKLFLGLRERRSCWRKDSHRVYLILKLPSKTHSWQWAAAAHGFLETAGNGWQKFWALVKSMAKLPQGAVESVSLWGPGWARRSFCSVEEGFWTWLE